MKGCFVIAKADLNLKIADLVRDNDILFRAREVAENIIEKDPKLSHPNHLVLKQQLNRLSGNRYDWGRIG